MPPKPSPPRLTHFLCIPLVTPTSRSQLQASLTTFREKTTGTRTAQNPDGIPAAAIRPLGTLHLTLGVMSLLTPERVESALSLLKSLNLRELIPVSGLVGSAKSGENEEGRVSLKGKGVDDERTSLIMVTLRGLESMHTPSKTSILYAPPVDDLYLRSFCLKLREAFAAADLLVPDSRPLLLHATILNTVYVPGVRGKGSGHGKNKAKLTIDATEILEYYEDFEWMSNVKVEKVAICRMGAQKKEDGTEEYVVEGEALMP
ncbi:hypothetical protein G7Y89_g12211 [Cudoniella acicularis]|uniref:A-kinase anchor protein 7-like phosphoesterase domain-containing protein n=1 Tax=Cudoniella acicularis TaxID=354080 RepID=A0A8H4VZE0_9HELO|nr:hypothetical protein G7Y89_g12211 [Cudoniella acicularis]